jgi:hypothetical protein
LRHGAQRLSPARNHAGQSPAPHMRARTMTASPSQKSPRSSSASQRPRSRLGWPAAKHGARGGVRWPQPCLKHRWPHLARPVQPIKRSGARHMAAWRRNRSQHKILLARRPVPLVVLARRRWAWGHGWPESATRSQGGSAAARRLAPRQGHPTAHPNAAGSTQRRNQGGREEEDGRGGAHVGTAV